MAESDQLLETIEAIHDAGLEPERWPDALEAVTRTLGGVAATLETFDRRTMDLTDFHSFGLPPAGEIAYLEEFAARNPRIPLMLNDRPGDVIYDYRILSEGEMHRSDFYADFLAPTGYRYFVGGALAASNRQSTLFSVQRTIKQGHVQGREIDLMRRLMPHLRQAHDVARRLGNAGAARRAFEASLDWLADGAGLIREDGTLLYANAALQEIARANDGIRIVNGGTLEFAAADERARFAGAVACACRLRGGDVGAAAITDFPATRPSGAPSWLVSLRPLLRSANSEGVAERACAVLFVRDPSRRHLSAIGLLREVFGFTAAEAALARALQAGVSPIDYARENALTHNTVYTHLRRIREKTGCKRQGDLVRTLTAILMPLRSD